jgi:hypothetical protein
MTRYFGFFIIALLFSATSHAHVDPVWKSKFQVNLEALLGDANALMGFDSLKDSELSRGEWSCRQELDGFLTTVREKEDDPRGVLFVSAISVKPVALKYVNYLILNGLNGYKMRDSNTDKTVPIDRTTQARKVVFSKRERYAQIILSVVFVAHEDNTVILTIEAR